MEKYSVKGFFCDFTLILHSNGNSSDGGYLPGRLPQL